MTKLCEIKNWYSLYINKPLTIEQPKFWVLFWGAAAISCVVYYVYTYNVISDVSQESRLATTKFVTAVCSLFPLLVLRRLHLLALFITTIFLFEE